MKKDYYCKHTILLLEDASTYMYRASLTSPDTDNERTKEISEKLRDRFNELDVFVNFAMSISKLYGLLKNHKSKLIKQPIKNKTTIW